VLERKVGLFAEGLESGYDDEDFAALIKVVERDARTPV